MIDRYEPGDEHTGMTKSDTGDYVMYEDLARAESALRTILNSCSSKEDYEPVNIEIGMIAKEALSDDYEQEDDGWFVYYEDHLAELAEMAKEIESLKAKLESKKWEIQVLDGEIKRLKDKAGIPLSALAGSILPLFL